MSDTYMCFNKFKNANIGDCITGYKDSSYNYDYVIYNYGIGIDTVIPENILNKYFLELNPNFSLIFKEKNIFRFNKNKHYSYEFNTIHDDVLKLIYRKIFIYIKKIEFLDELIFNNFQSAIINICNNLLVISKLTENYETEFKPLKIAIDDSEEVLKAMYETSLSIIEEAKSSDETKLILDEHKKAMNLYNEMFKDLNKI